MHYFWSQELRRSASNLEFTVDTLKGEKQQLKQTHLHTSLRLKEKLRVYRQLYKGLHAKATQLHAERQALLLHIRSLKADIQSGVTTNPPLSVENIRWTESPRDIISAGTKPSAQLQPPVIAHCASEAFWRGAPECQSHGLLRKEHMQPTSEQLCPRGPEELQDSHSRAPPLSHSVISSNIRVQRDSGTNYKSEDVGIYSSRLGPFLQVAPQGKLNALACSPSPFQPPQGNNTKIGTSFPCNNDWVAGNAAAAPAGTAADGALSSCRLLQARVQQLKKQYEQKQKQERVGMQVQTPLSPFRKAKVTVLGSIQTATERVPAF